MRPRPARISKSAFSHIKRTKTTRSGLESQVRAQLVNADGGLGYSKDERQIEAITYSAALKKYHPDFELPNGILIECKGWFKPTDRTKHLLVKAQHPELDIRFVFSNPNQKLSRTSKMTYAGWCEKNGFKYFKAVIPPWWFDEPRKGS